MSIKSTEFGSWSLTEIIDGRYFRVPAYQRGYAWGERQLEEFWDDLDAVVGSKGKHYTGAITVEELYDKPEVSTPKGYAVVDGQQRLTTMAILLSALNLESNPFLIKADSRCQHVFSYGAHNADQQFLCNILSGGEPGTPENAHRRNLKKAVEFFRNKTKDLNSDRRQEIANAVMRRMTFDFRILGSEYSAGMVFETMNNRGKPLTLLEKLKNRLMYLVSTLSVDGDEETRNIFDDENADLGEYINEAWGRIYRLLAANPQGDPLDEDEYVAAHLSVYRASKESVYSRAVAESRLFKMFCLDAERHPKSERVDETDAAAVEKERMKERMEEKVSIGKIRDYVSDLASFAESWSKMHADFTGALGHCRALSGSQEVKVFLATVLRDVSDEDVRNCIFEKAEQILFRNTIRSVMDEATLVTLARRLHGKCLDMLKKGDNEKIDAKDIADQLRGVADDGSRKIDADKLVDFCADLMDRQQSPYGFYGWRGLKYFLFKQEGDGGLAWSRFDDVSLEHVMPQSATEDKYNGWWVRQVQQFTKASGFEIWDDLSVDGKRDCRQCKRKLVNSLGNFVLLTQSENASVSDDPWESYPEVPGVHKKVIGKQAFYSDSDPSRTSSYGARCVAEINGSWNAFRIRERGRELFRKLATALGITEGLKDESIDLALGFDEVKSLKNTPFEALPDDDVNRLAPRLGTAAEQSLGQRNTCEGKEANIKFWEAFKKWCESNWKQWCHGKVKYDKSSAYYDPKGQGGRCHVFFRIGDSAASFKDLGRLVIIGISCHQGEKQRQAIAQYSKEFSEVGEWQDWEYARNRNDHNKAKNIYFARQLDWSDRTQWETIFARLAGDYEKISDILRRHGFRR